nr:hypothetical protein [uncultured Lichenicoccus sp.]
MRANGNRMWQSAAGLALALLLSGCVGAAAAGPEAGVAPGYGYVCHAGVYTCRLPQQVQVGSQCSCPAIGAPSYGTVD